MATRKSCFVLNGPNGSIKPCNFTTRRSTTTSFNCANQTLTYQLALAVVSMVAVDEVESNYWSTIIDWMRQCVSGDSSQKWMSATTPFICYNLLLSIEWGSASVGIVAKNGWVQPHPSFVTTYNWYNTSLKMKRVGLTKPLYIHFE